jgi:predicted  nucleic acid-binding Zn-ribbon protein
VTSALFTEILLGLIAAAIGVSSYLQARRANDEQARMSAAQAAAVTVTVDAGAYARAKDIYEGALATLRDELRSTRLDMKDLRNSNDQLRAEISGLRDEIGRLRSTAS